MVNCFLSTFCCSMLYVIFGTSHHISVGEVYFVLQNVSTGRRDCAQCCFKKPPGCPNLFHLKCRCYLDENPEPEILIVPPLCSWSVVRISGSQSSPSCEAPCPPEDTAPVSQTSQQRRQLECQWRRLLHKVKGQRKLLPIYPQDVTVIHDLAPGLLRGSCRFLLWLSCWWFYIFNLFRNQIIKILFMCLW